MSSNSQPSITTIQDLPDECLRHIFLNVPMSTTPGKSWIGLRTVCQRWSSIIDECWHEFNELFISDGLDKLTLRHKDRILMALTSKESRKKKTADKLIEHCGPYLKSLTECRILPTTTSIVPLAAEKCLKLEKFTGSVNTRADAKNLRDLLDACTKLKSLNINPVVKKLYSFFQRIPTHQLEQLIILTNGTVDPHLLKYIKATIRHCRVLNFLKTDFMDEELLGLLTTLRELHIMNPLHILPTFDHELMVSLSKNCQQLTSLSLEGLALTDQEISALSYLPKLKTLHLLNLVRFRGTSLKHFPKIEELKLVNCLVGDAEMRGVLENCPVLRSLSMAGINITDKTLTVAVRETSKRTNNITLKIYCATKANLKMFQGVSPFLQVFRIQ